MVALHDNKSGAEISVPANSVGYFEEAPDKSTKVVCRGDFGIHFVKESISQIKEVLSGAK